MPETTIARPYVRTQSLLPYIGSFGSLPQYVRVDTYNEIFARMYRTRQGWPDFCPKLRRRLTLFSRDAQDA